MSTLKTLPALFLVALMGLGLSSPIPLQAWELESGRLIQASLPAGITPEPVQIEADLDGNGTPERLVLKQGRVEITTAGRIAWQSPEGWDVVQAEFSDLNRDGAFEATLLVWHPFHSWPVDQWLPHGGRITSFHNANGDSCQIILVGWAGGQYREMWAGSALAEPVKSFAVADVDKDGTQELVTLENQYSDPSSAPARDLKIWKWNGFGFTVVNDIDGTFTKMALARASDGRILILVP